jgi:hypothetical protein
MASSVQAYQLTITNGSSGNAVPADGFVDNRTLESYDLDLASTQASLTLALAEAKKRGNIRYTDIITQLQRVQNCYVDPHSFESDATALAEASSFAFQIYAEHGDAAWVTADELNAGQTLTSTACIVRCVARALALDEFQVAAIFDPTNATSVPTGTTNVPRFGVRINVASDFEVGAYQSDLSIGASYVTVAKL